jgi:hypothetical protein
VSTVVYLFVFLIPGKRKTTIDTIIHRQTENIMAKKQKDKKINNGRHNNTQTNRQYNGQETKGQKDKQR